MRELAGEQDLAGVDDAPQLATIEGHSRTLGHATLSAQVASLLITHVASAESLGLTRGDHLPEGAAKTRVG